MFRFIILIGIILFLFIPLYRFIKFCFEYFLDEVSESNKDLSKEYKETKEKMKNVINEINDEIEFLDQEKQKLENLKGNKNER